MLFNPFPLTCPDSLFMWLCGLSCGMYFLPMAMRFNPSICVRELINEEFITASTSLTYNHNNAAAA